MTYNLKTKRASLIVKKKISYCSLLLVSRTSLERKCLKPLESATEQASQLEWLLEITLSLPKPLQKKLGSPKKERTSSLCKDLISSNSLEE
jgi:hypothetical protein